MAFDARAVAERIGGESEGSVRVVAIDGRSGVGKSTFAGALAAAFEAGGRRSARIIDGDDFFAGGVELRVEPPRALVDVCIDWRAQRRVLAALRRREPARWHAFDWEAFDGSRRTDATQCAPADIVVLEGVYSARPELADLVDLRVLLRISAEERLARLLRREGEIGAWERQWHAAEDVYFEEIAPPSIFDVVLEEEIA